MPIATGAGSAVQSNQILPGVLRPNVRGGTTSPCPRSTPGRILNVELNRSAVGLFSVFLFLQGDLISGRFFVGAVTIFLLTAFPLR
jgi:hypothetical protein